jgi:DNA adenine methylase
VRDTAPTRPVLRYHGGKWRLAPWVIEHLPPHRIYVEPYGGAASVLMRKPRAYAEVYNDLNGEVVNVFRVLRDSVQAERLTQLLRLTPFAREEFFLAYVPAPEDPVEQARRTIVKSFAGFASTSIHDPKPVAMRTRASVWRAPTGFRANAHRSGTTPAHDWRHYPDAVPDFVERLQGVVVENRRAHEVIEQHDREDTLFYVDPPYLHSTRSAMAGRGKAHRCYRHEMSEGGPEELVDDSGNLTHHGLAALLREVKGMVVLSGYPSPLYQDDLYQGWFRVQRTALADGTKRRTEVLWLNGAARAALECVQETLL